MQGTFCLLVFCRKDLCEVRVKPKMSSNFQTTFPDIPPHKFVFTCSDDVCRIAIRYTPHQIVYDLCISTARYTPQILDDLCTSAARFTPQNIQLQILVASP